LNVNISKLAEISAKHIQHSQLLYQSIWYAIYSHVRPDACVYHVTLNLPVM